MTSGRRTASFALGPLTYYSDVIPAQAGIQGLGEGGGERDLYAEVVNLVVQARPAVYWIPACAGMTVMMPPPTEHFGRMR